MRITNEDQKVFTQAMREAEVAYSNAFRVREYFIRLRQSVKDDPNRCKVVEQWQLVATHACNIVHDTKVTLSHAYDVMQQWECEDER